MKLEHLTIESFKQKIFNFEASKEWKFEGDNPAIIDFYATAATMIAVFFIR